MDVENLFDQYASQRMADTTSRHNDSHSDGTCDDDHVDFHYDVDY